jgi:hypothetical protein
MTLARPGQAQLSELDASNGSFAGQEGVLLPGRSIGIS